MVSNSILNVCATSLSKIFATSPSLCYNQPSEASWNTKSLTHTGVTCHFSIWCELVTCLNNELLYYKIDYYEKNKKSWKARLSYSIDLHENCPNDRSLLLLPQLNKFKAVSFQKWHVGHHAQRQASSHACLQARASMVHTSKLRSYHNT